MPGLAVFIFLVCPLSFQAFRLVKKRSDDLDVVEVAPLDADVVDAIYTFGAPGVASPELVNQRTPNGCFNGLRTYQSRPGDLWGKHIDPVPFVTNAISFWHAKMMAREVDEKQPDRFAAKPCSHPNVTYLPASFLDGTANANLHRSERYLKTIFGLGDRTLSDHAFFALVLAYLDDPAEVTKASRERGWKLVGYAEDLSENFTHGPQVSHLLQKPETLECVITFEGTDSDNGNDDWYANFEYDREKFCGFVDEDEVCDHYSSDCSVRHPGGAFVHRGFANKARSIAQTAGWNNTIRGNLHACSKVSVAGHSAGGAVAELVAGCLSKRLAPGDFGYEDRALFGWTPADDPVELPELGPESIQRYRDLAAAAAEGLSGA